MDNNRLKEVKGLRSRVRNANESSAEKMTSIERWAIGVTKSVGGIGFFTFLVSLSVIWILWNIFLPEEFRFDPYPAFVLWLFISNLVQLILMPLLLIGQNLLNKQAEARADEEFRINKIAEKEIELILDYLKHHSDQLETITSKKKSKRVK